MLMDRRTCVIVLAALTLLAGCASGTPGGNNPGGLGSSWETPGATNPPSGRQVGTPPAGDVASHLATGDAALDGNDLATAEREYRDASRLDPASAKAQFGLGNVYVRQGKFLEAETAFKAAVALDPRSAASYANLAVTYYQMDKLQEAADALESALRIEPDDAQTLYLMGAVRLQLGDLATSEQYLLKARESDPNLPEVYYGLGALYKLKGQKQEAIAAFEKFLAIGPGQDAAAVSHAQQELDELRQQQ